MSGDVGACEVHIPGRDQPSEWCAACRIVAPGSSGDAGAEVAAVLAAHVLSERTARCSCGEDFDRFGWRDLHASHVANALTPLIAERVEAAKAEATSPQGEGVGSWHPDHPDRVAARAERDTRRRDDIEDRIAEKAGREFMTAQPTPRDHRDDATEGDADE